MAVTLSDPFNGTDITASWTRSNAGSATAVVAAGVLTLAKTSSGSDVARIVAAASYTWDASERVPMQFNATPTVISGMALRSTDSFSPWIGYGPGTGNTRAMSYNVATNRIGGSLGVTAGYYPHLAIRRSGTDLLFERSSDGASWTTFHTEPVATFTTVTPVTPVLIAEDWFNTAAAGSGVFAAFNGGGALSVPAVLEYLAAQARMAGIHPY